MFVDLETIERFYKSTYGKSHKEAVVSAISERWRNLLGQSVLGIGYSLPYLETLSKKGGISTSVMPQRLGVVAWPENDFNKSCQASLNHLPFRDNFFDRVLISHALELEGNASGVLEEVYRVLAPGGKAIVVLPNRVGLLARNEHTPFGRGTPYTKSQLKHLLREVNFTPLGWSGVGFLPPTKNGKPNRLFGFQGPVARGALKPFSGVIVMEAEKRVFSGIEPLKEKERSFKGHPAPI